MSTRIIPSYGEADAKHPCALRIKVGTLRSNFKDRTGTLARLGGKTQRHYEVKLRWELLRSIESGEDVTGWKSEGYHGTGDITINEWFDIPCDFDKRSSTVEVTVVDHHALKTTKVLGKCSILLSQFPINKPGEAKRYELLGEQVDKMRKESVASDDDAESFAIELEVSRVDLRQQPWQPPGSLPSSPEDDNSVGSARQTSRPMSLPTSLPAMNSLDSSQTPSQPEFFHDRLLSSASVSLPHHTHSAAALGADTSASASSSGLVSSSRRELAASSLGVRPAGALDLSLGMASRLQRDMSGNFKGDYSMSASPLDYFLAAGWLSKQRDGHMRTGWCRRFLVMSDTHLWYFHGREGLLAEVRGELELKDVHGVSVANLAPTPETDSSDGPPPLFAIEIEFPPHSLSKKVASATGGARKKRLIFGTMTRVSAEQWATAIRNAAALSKNPGVATAGTPVSQHENEAARSRLNMLQLVRDKVSAAVDSAHPTAAPPTAPKPPGGLAGVGGLIAAMLGLAWASPIGRNIAVVVLVLTLLYTCVRYRQLYHVSAHLVEEANAALTTHRELHSSLLAATALVDDEDDPDEPEEKEPESLLPGICKVETLPWQGMEGKPEGEAMPGPMTWANGIGARIPVRCGGGKKAPSGEPLYECIGFHLLKPERRKVRGWAASRASSIPFVEGVTNESMAGCPLPRLVVVNVQLPLKPATMMGGVDPKHIGLTAILIFHITPATVAAAAAGTGGPSVKLMGKFMAECIKNGRHDKDLTAWSDDDACEMRKRFKMIGFLDNVDDQASVLGSMVTSLVRQFNGKPVIVYKSGAASMAAQPKTVAVADGNEAQYEDYLECTCKVQNFAYLATSNIPHVLQKVGGMLLSVGFVIQGDDNDEEMPEKLLGCAQFHRIDIAQAVPFAQD